MVECMRVWWVGPSGAAGTFSRVGVQRPVGGVTRLLATAPRSEARSRVGVARWGSHPSSGVLVAMAGKAMEGGVASFAPTVHGAPRVATLGTVPLLSEAGDP